MKDIQDVCSKLSPIIGSKADQLWKLYLIGNEKRRKRIERTIRRLQVKYLLNQESGEGKILLPPPSKEQSKGEYPIGRVVYDNKELHQFALREEDWPQHISIFGRTGAGKTNVSMMLLSNLVYRDKPFLVFDWKRSYRPILNCPGAKDIEFFTVGRDVAPYFFNPLVFPEGTDPKTWIKKIAEITCRAEYGGDGVRLLLIKGIDHLYKEYGVYKKHKPEQFPTMKDVYEYLLEYKSRGGSRESNWLVSALRALKDLSFGAIGKVVNNRASFCVEELLKKQVVLELEALSENGKTFLVDSLLLWIHHYRLAEDVRGGFKHAVFVEEAHHILKKQVGFGSDRVIDVLLKEVREFGEAIVVLDQSPSEISLNALANTATSIFMNLKTKPDVSAAASCLLLDEKEYLGELPCGYAIMKMQDRFTKPFLVRFPLVKIRKGDISDAALRLRSVNRRECSEFSAGNASSLKAEDMEPSATEDRIDEIHNLLMEDISKHELSGVIARYQRIGISRKKGTTAKEELIRMKLVKQEEVKTESGKTMLLELTDKGRRYVKNRTKKNESLEHKYFKAKVANMYRDEGYRVIEEEDNRGQGCDLVLVKGDKTIAVEIETGKSDIRRNMERNKGFDEVIIVPTSEKARKKVEKVVAGSDVVVMDV